MLEKNVGVMQPAQNGKQVALSIDNRIQYIAYNALKKSSSFIRS